jgi:Protein of unknown function (DUF2808)/Trypsin-like peptidase domain
MFLPVSLVSVFMLPLTVATIDSLKLAASQGVDVNQVAKPATVLIQGTGSGSGVIFRQQGNKYFVLTAKHVVDTPASYRLSTSDGQQHSIPFNEIQRFPDVDLAIIPFTSSQNYPTIKLGNSDRLSEGDLVYIAGWPAAGAAIPHIYQLTSGAISGLSPRPLPGGYRLIYTNVTRAGMSGGPIFNNQAEVIGIHGQAEGREVFLPNRESQSSEVIKAGFNLGIPINTFLLKENPSLVTAVAAPEPTLPSQPNTSPPKTLTPLPSKTQRTSFVQLPTLVKAVTSNRDANVLGALYYFTIDLPIGANAPLQQVDFHLTQGLNYPDFSAKGTEAFVGDRRSQGPKIPLGLVVTDPLSQTITVTFDPPVAPGQKVTIALRPLQNPNPGTYLFEVRGYPEGSLAQNSYIGLGRLDFYPKSRW